MDPFTQGVLGAALAQSFAKKSKIPMACLVGTAGGLAPDLDVLIRSASDPLIGIEFHRHFSHSIWFIPIGGFIVATLLWLLFRKNRTFKDLYIFATLGYATHALLDACTSYGTRLFWPLSNTRVAWDAVSIIDPVPTLSLFIFVILSYRMKSAKMARVAMACMIGYLSLGFLQNYRVTNTIEQLAIARGHDIERIKLNPTIGNLIVWRTIYQYEGHYYVNAVIAQPFEQPQVINGSSVAMIDAESIYGELGQDSTQRRDLRRFSYFAEDYLFEYKGGIADLRYSAEPHKIQPIWGIMMDKDNPENHVTYSNFSRSNGRGLEATWAMLTGNYKIETNELAF